MTPLSKSEEIDLRSRALAHAIEAGLPVSMALPEAAKIFEFLKEGILPPGIPPKVRA